MAESLRTCGFDVRLEMDVTLSKLRDAVTEMYYRIDKLKERGADVLALFYFAGHSIRVAPASGGAGAGPASSPPPVNYLLAKDTVFKSELELQQRAYRLQDILRCFEEAESDVNIFILDTCRPMPDLTRALALRQPSCGATLPGSLLRPTLVNGLQCGGLQVGHPLPAGSILACSLCPAEVALEEGEGGHGAFTGKLLETLQEGAGGGSIVLHSLLEASGSLLNLILFASIFWHTMHAERFPPA
ncbi:hypothetical protein CYMTET_21477 [Cymbomonas tetramitiformis]|uniref:Peptidase C14 caspase domain-containing protein n=1 Tax=Cymbomonas tetramitiformis TaxID=36881 RepID=A0AAE0G3A0_9CHLO|nr:hypothetical protein CYMTET_21477 [Cymbomonas tetramitiformis]